MIILITDQQYLKDNVILISEKALLIDGIKHFIQEQRPKEICDEIFSFVLAKVDR